MWNYFIINPIMDMRLRMYRLYKLFKEKSLNFDEYDVLMDMANVRYSFETLTKQELMDIVDTTKNLYVQLADSYLEEARKWQDKLSDKYYSEHGITKF